MMEKQIEDLKSNIPIVLLALYAFGYAYFKPFYKFFNIDFEYYVSLSDLIFFSISNLIYVLFLYIAIDLMVMVLAYIFKEYFFRITIRFLNKKRDDSNQLVGPGYRDIKTVFQAITFLILAYFIFSYLQEGKSYFSDIVFAIPIAAILIVTLRAKEIKERNKDFPFSLFLTIIFLVAFLVSMFFLSDSNAKAIKEGINSKSVSFYLNGTEYSTKNRYFIYVGETSNYIFFYHTETKESMAFNKNEISMIKYKP